MTIKPGEKYVEDSGAARETGQTTAPSTVFIMFNGFVTRRLTRAGARRESLDPISRRDSDRPRRSPLPSFSFVSSVLVA